MRAYGYSEVGQYHLNAGSDICQDSHYELVINEYVAVAAVADGLGSQTMSQVGSEIASKFAVQYCYDHYGEMPISDLIKAAFKWASLKVRKGSKEMDIPYDQMDCTLCLVVMTPNRIYYGNVGDSGCLLLKKSGEIVPLTNQQNDNEGRTNVLRFDRTWEFGDIEGIFVSALLCTDGVYNRIYAPFLRDYLNSDDPEPVVDHDFVYALAVPRVNGSWVSDKDHLERVKKIFEYTPKTLKNPAGIVDDITVVIMSYDVPCDEFYTEHIDYNSCVKQFKEYHKRIIEERDRKAMSESDGAFVSFIDSGNDNASDDNDVQTQSTEDFQQSEQNVDLGVVSEQDVEESSSENSEGDVIRGSEPESSEERSDLQSLENKSELEPSLCDSKLGPSKNSSEWGGDSQTDLNSQEDVSQEEEGRIDDADDSSGESGEVNKVPKVEGNDSSHFGFMNLGNPLKNLMKKQGPNQ